MFRFTKEERLCSRKLIAEVYKSGSSLLLYPLLFKYLPAQNLNEKVKAAIVFVVAKKKVPLAVNRNLIKRQMREAYRLQKPKFYQELINKNLSVYLFVSFVGKNAINYEQIERAMRNGCMKMVKSFSDE